MIITSRNQKFYKLQMTAEQAHCLQLFFESDHKNETGLIEVHGAELGMEIHETLKDLRRALRTR